MEKFRGGKSSFFRVISDGFEYSFYFMNLNGISILFCTVLMLFRPIFVLFSYNFINTVFAFLHPIFDLFS